MQCHAATKGTTHPPRSSLQANWCTFPSRSASRSPLPHTYIGHTSQQSAEAKQKAHLPSPLLAGPENSPTQQIAGLTSQQVHASWNSCWLRCTTSICCCENAEVNTDKPAAQSKKALHFEGMLLMMMQHHTVPCLQASIMHSTHARQACWLPDNPDSTQPASMRPSTASYTQLCSCTL